MMAICRQLVERAGEDVDVLLDVGVLLMSNGFLARASECFEKVRVLAAHDARPLLNLASIARDSGKHAEARNIHRSLLAAQPDNPMMRANFLLGQEYDPSVTDSERLRVAREWGEWAIARAGGPRPRPASTPLTGRPLRVGYVSADLYHHPVGWFVKEVFKAHDPEQVVAFTYSAGQANDAVTAEIRGASTFRDVSASTDSELANLIRGDAIDVLVDLSGHTGGSRLLAFAHRPAPVQVSWLGYFATTGLPTVDAVILDSWHAPAGTKTQFTEKIVRLQGGRFCYQPAPFAPPVSPPPCLAKDVVTFGSYNNTAKLNQDVFALWAGIMDAVPNSRLILKWRTFNDDGLRRSVATAFERRGIRASRIEMRGASFHVDLLREYADMDIALDPFPFSGGMTSCEALWMGVPVVTWPQSRIVSRQTLALASAIGLPELAARDAGEYMRIAARLASDRARLGSLRNEMRQRMTASSLMDVNGFTRRFEQCLAGLFEEFRVEA